MQLEIKNDLFRLISNTDSNIYYLSLQTVLKIGLQTHDKDYVSG